MKIKSKGAATVTKPQFKIRIKPKVSASPFHQVVREAIDVSERLNTAHSGRLSGPACLREAMALAKCSKQQLDELRTALRHGRPGLERSRASINTIKRELIYTKRLNTIPSDATELAKRLNYYCRGASGELSGLNASTLHLLCVALAEAIDEKGAELFGSVDSSADLKVNVAELQAKQRELFAQILKTMTVEDWQIGEADKNHKADVSFKIAPSVSVVPKENAGERLVAYLMAHREKRP